MPVTLNSTTGVITPNLTVTGNTTLINLNTTQTINALSYPINTTSNDVYLKANTISCSNLTRPVYPRVFSSAKNESISAGSVYTLLSDLPSWVSRITICMEQYSSVVTTRHNVVIGTLSGGTITWIQTGYNSARASDAANAADTTGFMLRDDSTAAKYSYCVSTLGIYDDGTNKTFTWNGTLFEQSGKCIMYGGSYTGTYASANKLCIGVYSIIALSPFNYSVVYE